MSKWEHLLELMQPTHKMLYVGLVDQSSATLQALGMYPFDRKTLTELLKRLRIPYQHFEDIDNLSGNREYSFLLMMNNRQDAKNAADTVYHHVFNALGNTNGKITINAIESINPDFYDTGMSGSVWEYNRTI